MYGFSRQGDSLSTGHYQGGVHTTLATQWTINSYLIDTLS